VRAQKPLAIIICLAIWLLAGCTQHAPDSTPAASAPTSAPSPAFHGALVVSAASDLIPAFQEIGARFTAETGIPVTFNFGSSGLLAQQIEQGAPVDVYAAANVSFVDELLAGGHVLSDTVALYGIGRITLWMRADSPLDITTLDELTDPAVTRIAIANPEHAPYGVAAREALQSAELWETLQPKLILGENIAATLQYVETGNVDVGIIALSLSIAAGDEGRWTLIPADLHAPIEQALAVVTRTSHEAEARRFAEYVNQGESREIMRRYGFLLPDEVRPDAAILDGFAQDEDSE
jgi:molybdate transport system substrate-binding protein